MFAKIIEWMENQAILFNVENHKYETDSDAPFDG